MKVMYHHDDTAGGQSWVENSFKNIKLIMFE